MTDTKRLDVFEIERQAQVLRAEATRDAFARLGAWLRTRLATGTKAAA